jgi:hypothetical protein
LVIVIEGRLLDPEAVNPVTDPALATPVHAKVVPVALGAHVTATVLAPEQIVCVKDVFVMVGVGLTVTKNEAGVPGQLLNVGVTLIVPVIVPGVLLLVLTGAVQGAICPLPDATNPI